MYLWRPLLYCILAGVLTGCERSPAPLNHPWAADVTGTGQVASFRLMDMYGHARSATDWRGKVLLLFFGYTHCPEVCPTTLYTLAQTMRQLGPAADDVQVVFVTLDPQRDTAAVLRQFVPFFDRRFLGLYGSVSATQALEKTYGVYVQRHDTSVVGDYTLDHSAFIYAFDRHGRLRLKMPYGETSMQMASDIRQLQVSGSR